MFDDIMEFEEKEKLPNLKPVDGLKLCASACLTNEIECPFSECKYWINHKKDFNCDLISINKLGGMTLREVAARIGVSYVRIKQIEDKALKKVSKKLSILGQ